MNVLIDTNVVLDIVLRRTPFYADAVRIQVLSEKEIINGYISAASVTDVFYIAVRELKDKNSVLDFLRNLLKTFRVASVTENIINEALNLGWDDFEDSVQYVTGRSIFADCIITRNQQDFANSGIEVLLPKQFLDRFNLS